MVTQIYTSSHQIYPKVDQSTYFQSLTTPPRPIKIPFQKSPKKKYECLPAFGGQDGDEGGQNEIEIVFMVIYNSMQNPWKNLPKKAPYILTHDQKVIKAFNKRVAKEYKINEKLLPDPFLGKPKAPVVLLNLNPGMDGTESKLHKDPSFRPAFFANLRHEHASFYYFDRKFKNTSGSTWWRRKMKEIIFELTKSLKDEQKTLDLLGKKIFVIEYFPYHSKKFHNPGRIGSQDYNVHLVRQAIKRNALIIMMRGEKKWLKLVPELKRKKYPTLKSPQAAALSRRNLGNRVFNKLIKKLNSNG